MEKTPAELLREYFYQCGEEVVIYAEEDKISSDCNMLRVYGVIDEKKSLLFTLMGTNLRQEFESLFEFVCSSMNEEYDSAD